MPARAACWYSCRLQDPVGSSRGRLGATAVDKYGVILLHLPGAHATVAHGACCVRDICQDLCC